MARHPSPQIAQRQTLLAVGEGKADAAFLRYLRGLYCSGRQGVSVTIRNANGKGPSNVISTAIGALRIASFDQKLCLMDTDIVWTAKNISDAKRHKIQLIGAVPCLEGLLLRILDKSVPTTSDDCKRQLKSITGKSMLEAEDYAGYFPHELLQHARIRMAELDRLLRLFEGR